MARWRSTAIAMREPTEAANVIASSDVTILHIATPNGHVSSFIFKMFIGTLIRTTFRSANARFAIKRLVTVFILGFRYASTTNILPKAPQTITIVLKNAQGKNSIVSGFGTTKPVELLTEIPVILLACKAKMFSTRCIVDISVLPVDEQPAPQILTNRFEFSFIIY